MTKVLLTGAAGYTGSVLTRHLLDRGYKVFGLDVLMFGRQSLKEFEQNPNFKFFMADIRSSEIYKPILEEVDAIIHLAAICGMTACDKYPDLTKKTNWIATKELFSLANKSKNIRRFIFASSTSVYGTVSGNGFVNEKSICRPLTLYAQLKLRCEDYLLNFVTRRGLAPTVLRFPTAYGLSPRMRFDLTVNEFTRDLTFGKKLEIFGEQFWRPYCHVEDLAEACIKVLEVEERLVDHEVYCVGDTRENYTKKMIYETLVDLIPDGEVSLVQRVHDPRDYRVDFSKIKKIGFATTKTVKDGIREIYHALRQGLITDPYDPIYTSVF